MTSFACFVATPLLLNLQKKKQKKKTLKLPKKNYIETENYLHMVQHHIILVEDPEEDDSISKIWGIWGMFIT